ncbi:hypothetical protein CYY_003070 [Polysphondylium violaceum]|uniref:Small-subunit processome Utp12 domain-containing protein n=1 Tax=Polysphondylium violaceum TaxID=133409 RepID=A0A8J4V6A8_9MYCE|nr:hypothetical protein CYY_003070 [Polysphondylium violaceum]
MSHSLFDNDGALFARITKDNRVQVFNSLNAKLVQTFSEKDQSNNQNTCIAWSSLKSTDKNINNKLLACGTKKGDIFVYDLIDMKRVAHLRGHNTKVKDLIFSTKVANCLYSADNEGNVIQWDVSNPKQKVKRFRADSKSLSWMAINKESTILATCDHDVKLWDLSSLEMLTKFSAHQSEIKDICFSSDSQYIFTTSGDRYICVWSASPSKEQQESSKPLLTLTSESQIRSINTYHINKQHIITALSDSNQISVWSFQDSKLSSAKTTPLSKIILPTNPTLNLTIFSTILIDNTQIMVSYGQITSTKFKKITFYENNSFIENIRIEDTFEDKSNSTTTANKSLEPALKKKKEVLSTQGSVVKVESNNVPLPETVEKSSSKNKIASAGTVIDLITQSLRSNDEVLLYKALRVNFSVVNNTVKLLPPPYAYSLLTRILKDIATDNTKSHVLLPWVNTIIRCHSTYLLSIPNLSKQLSILNAIIEDKFNLHDKLSKLVGKFELVESQSQSNQVTSVDYDPTLVYEEASDDDEEQEQDDDSMGEDEEDDQESEEFASMDEFEDGDEDDEDFEDDE